MTRVAVWISFDLGVNGDYSNMYTWLDEHGAKECGDSMAFLKYNSNDDPLEDIKAELKQRVELDRKSRIYVITVVDGSIKGRFICGQRRKAPWVGYAEINDQEEDIGG